MSVTRMRQISKSFSVLLAKALILWDERVLSHLVSFKRGTRIDGFHEYFYRTFHSESAYISRADFDAAVLCFVQEKPRLIDWYVELLTSISSGILWHDKQPIISPRYIITWEALCGDFDPDALLTLDLVIAHGTENCIRHIDELTNWKTIAYVGDNGFLLNCGSEGYPTCMCTSGARAFHKWLGRSCCRGSPLLHFLRSCAVYIGVRVMILSWIRNYVI